MKRSSFRRLRARLGWSNAPTAIVLIAALLLLAGIGVIAQNEAAYRNLKAQETRVQAEILAASVTAALDFGDAAAVQEAVEAIRVNRQLRTIGVYDSAGNLVTGYGRDGAAPPATVDQLAAWSATAVAAIVPVLSGGEQIGSIYLGADPEPVSRRLTRYFLIGLLVLLSTLVVSVLGLGQAALRRANRSLEERARALVQANAELKVQISERAKAEDQLRQSQKLQALGQLTGGIAHDFNNLLTVIQGSADMLCRPELPENKRLRFADAVVQAANRAAALTGQLLAFARRQPLQPEIIDVNDLILGMTELLDRTLGERIDVRTELADRGCPVAADRTQLESALLNVSVNARDAMPEGGTLTIRTDTCDDPETGAMIAISVADTGMGMDEDTLNRAIEPFFTTKSTGKGTGLGLSQVYGFATQSGGDVRIDSALGRGTTVTLLLPCSRTIARTADNPDHSRPETGRRGRVLLVEDNEAVGEFAEILLTELGHRVTRASSGESALELARTETFDVVFSDVVMPGMSGLELADILKRERPDLPIILTTGYSDQIAASGTSGLPMLLKPYRLDTLAEALDRVLPDHG